MVTIKARHIERGAICFMHSAPLCYLLGDCLSPLLFPRRGLKECGEAKRLRVRQTIHTKERV